MVITPRQEAILRHLARDARRSARSSTRCSTTACPWCVTPIVISKLKLISTSENSVAELANPRIYYSFYQLTKPGASHRVFGVSR